MVQYGATRERLKEIADDGDGWDVLHLSGHGAGGVFLLEKADGSPDRVPTADLLALLRPARRRVKLAVVSACESAADATAETYRLLGLTEQAEALEAESVPAAAEDEQSGSAERRHATEVPGLARGLVRELGCAVVAMRYPVTDDCANAFGDAFYEQVLRHRKPVDAAVAHAVAEGAGPASTAARPAVSLATPGVFGTRAIGLRLDLPRGRPVLDPAEQKMAYFPDEPTRFVGRASAMAQASAALAPNSGKTGVLLHGMAGAGKTACALELAYRHEDSFAALVFWQAPTRDDEWTSALPDLANRLDIQLRDYGFTMASHIGTQAALDAFLPRLRAVLASAGLLLVLDNLETLLTPDGGWRDPRWGSLIAALTSHEGESRVILTSRVPPAPTASATVTLPVHALSLGEFSLASPIAGELVNLLLVRGRLTEALQATEQKAEYTRQAGLGPWTQLLDGGQRLQVLGIMGEHEQVLTEVAELRTRMRELAGDTAGTEYLTSWNVREGILGVGRLSALEVGDLQLSLDLNAESMASKRQRGAGLHEVTRFRFNDTGPLIRLVRLAEAERLLSECQRVFEDHADTRNLAKVLSQRATLEADLGHRQAAADLERSALRLFYTQPDSRGIAASHYNLANCLVALGDDPVSQRAHRLAAALIYRLAGMSRDFADAAQALATEMRAAGDDQTLPSTVAEVTAAAALTEGVRLDALLAALQPDPHAVEEALAEILHAANELPPEDDEPDIAAYLHQWEPLIAAIVASSQPGQEAPPELLQVLDEYAERPDWAALTAALRRILAGERDPSLLDGLDPIDRAIAEETLSRVTQEADEGTGATTRSG